jgi:hypothetical protein
MQMSIERSGFYYAVVSRDVTAYDLTGSTNHLIHYVGHEVEITGKPTVLSLHDHDSRGIDGRRVSRFGGEDCEGIVGDV